MTWQIFYTKEAQKDAKKIAQSKLKNNAQSILDILALDPYQSPPPYKQLVGNLAGIFSRRINIQHRLIYQVLDNEKIVKVVSMWTHYQN